MYGINCWFSIFEIQAVILDFGSLKYLCNFRFEQEILHLLLKYYKDRLKIVVSVANFRLFNMATTVIFLFKNRQIISHFLIQLTVLHSLVKSHDDRPTFTKNTGHSRISSWRLPPSWILENHKLFAIFKWSKSFWIYWQNFIEFCEILWQ